MHHIKNGKYKKNVPLEETATLKLQFSNYLQNWHEAQKLTLRIMLEENPHTTLGK
jgi:hypothetical protein